MIVYRVRMFLLWRSASQSPELQIPLIRAKEQVIPQKKKTEKFNTENDLMENNYHGKKITEKKRKKIFRMDSFHRKY